MVLGPGWGLVNKRHSYKNRQVSEKTPHRRWIQHVLQVLHLEQWLEMLGFTLRIQKSFLVVGNVS